jgi:hypothetical protein
MARRHALGNDERGPVAESVDAGAVHRSLSWFKSRPGLQIPPQRAIYWCGSPKMPVDGSLMTLSRMRNLV